MTLLWQKDDTAVDPRIQRFLAGEDVLADRALFPFDIEATKAHARGLARISVMTAPDAEKIAVSLDALATAFKDGTFVLDHRWEDGHSAIEDVLTRELGELGRRVHTGRSRNDQVQVATRLYMRDRLVQSSSLTHAIAEALLDRAEKDGALPMPGYTHLQRAVPSSVGLWLAAFAESFLDDAVLLRKTAAWLDTCPLGTAAGYGVNLPLDRKGVAKELGFSRLQVNPMYAQNSRGKHELAVLSAVGQAMLDVRRLAWDLSLFTSAEFGFVRLPSIFMTGSSIMPNKRNPDVVELLRAAYARGLGAQVEISSVLGLPSGYHRDLQATKAPFVAATDHALGALALVPRLVSDLELVPERMRAAIDAEMFATDRAMELAVGGVPFRDAYQDVARQKIAEARTPEESLKARVSPGACADLQLDELRARLAREREAP